MPMLQGKQSGLPQDFLIKWQAMIKQLLTFCYWSSGKYFNVSRF